MKTRLKIRAAARLGGRAVYDQSAHGGVRGFGELKWLLRRGGRNTRESDGPHMLRMLPKILECGLCPYELPYRLIRRYPSSIAIGVVLADSVNLAGRIV